MLLVNITLPYLKMFYKLTPVKNRASELAARCQKFYREIYDFLQCSLVTMTVKHFKGRHAFSFAFIINWNLKGTICSDIPLTVYSILEGFLDPAKQTA